MAVQYISFFILYIYIIVHRGILNVFFDGFEILGAEHIHKLQEDVPVVIIANHQSMLDVAAIFALDLKAAWVAKTTVFMMPVSFLLLACLLAVVVALSLFSKLQKHHSHQQTTTTIIIIIIIIIINERVLVGSCIWLAMFLWKGRTMVASKECMSSARRWHEKGGHLFYSLK
jgi:hypothetical protein